MGPALVAATTGAVALASSSGWVAQLPRRASATADEPAAAGSWRALWWIPALNVAVAVGVLWTQAANRWYARR